MRYLAFLLRAFLLLVTVLAISALLVWNYKPRWVMKYDKKAQGYYLNHYHKPVDHALTTMRKDPAKGIDDLRAALDRFPPVFKEDKLFNKRQASNIQLAKALLKSGEIEEAESVARTTYEADTHNLNAHLTWIDCLLASESTKPKGLLEQFSLSDKFPGHLEFAKRSLSAHKEAGNVKEVTQVAIDYVGAPGADLHGAMGLNGAWLGWWSHRKAYVPQKRMRASFTQEGPMIDVRFKMPKGNAYVRLDFPASCYAKLKIHSFVGIVGDKRIPIPLDPEVMVTKHLEWNGLQVNAAGQPDPWFAVPLPRSLRGKAMEVVFTGELNGSLPWLAEALQTPTAIDKTYQLVKEGRPDIAKKVHALQMNTWMHKGLKFTWNGTEETSPLETTASSNGSLYFESVLELPRTGAVWNLIPEPANAWEIGALTMQSSDQSEAINFETQPSNMAETSESSWVATSPNSAFAIAVDGWDSGPEFKTITLRGWIK